MFLLADAKAYEFFSKDFQKVHYMYMFSFTDVSQVNESQRSGLTVDLVDGLKTSMCQPTLYVLYAKVSTKLYGSAGILICY